MGAVNEGKLFTAPNLHVSLNVPPNISLVLDRIVRKVSALFELVRVYSNAKNLFPITSSFLISHITDRSSLKQKQKQRQTQNQNQKQLLPFLSFFFPFFFFLPFFSISLFSHSFFLTA